VKVLFDEDVANHIAPEPCIVFREEQGEASAGDRAGWPLSRERSFSRTPTGLRTRKATQAAASTRAAVWSGVVGDPSMHGRSLYGNRDISSLAEGFAHLRSALGRPYGRSQR
jgi:hypothetical protein